IRRNQTESQRAQTSTRKPASFVSSGRSQRATRGWTFGSKVRYAPTTASQIAARLQRKTSTIRRMAPRYFPLEAQARRAVLAERAGSNGGDLTPTDFGEVEEELELEASALARCVERIQAAGALVKDLDQGLLDFPALRDGEEVLLCWRLGEDEIAYYHGTDEGFAGRRPLFGTDE